MSTKQGITVHFSEAHDRLGPAYLEVRFPKGESVDGDILALVGAHFSRAVEAHNIKPQPIQAHVTFGQTILTMDLSQYNNVPKGEYLERLDTCAMGFQNAIPELIRQWTA